MRGQISECYILICLSGRIKKIKDQIKYNVYEYLKLIMKGKLIKYILIIVKKKWYAVVSSLIIVSG